MKDPKDMLMTELQENRQLLKNWLFVSRYGSTVKLVGGELKVVRVEPTDEEKLLEARFKELTDELIRRRTEEDERWKRTESES